MCNFFAVTVVFSTLEDVLLSVGTHLADEVFPTCLYREDIHFRCYILTWYVSGRGDKIEINCSCGHPDTVKDMVACDGCDQWFHLSCVDVEYAPGDWFVQIVNDSDYFFCSDKLLIALSILQVYLIVLSTLKKKYIMFQ